MKRPAVSFSHSLLGSAKNAAGEGARVPPRMKESVLGAGCQLTLCGPFVQTPRPTPVLATRSWESEDQTIFKRIKGAII